MYNNRGRRDYAEQTRKTLWDGVKKGTKILVSTKTVSYTHLTLPTNREV